MASCFLAMLFGVLIFSGGMLFERFDFTTPEETEEKEKTEINTDFLKQWENLLNYDGNGQEEEHED